MGSGCQAKLGETVRITGPTAVDLAADMYASFERVYLRTLQESHPSIPRPNLTEAAFRGSSWTIVQVALNKGAAAVASFILGSLLSAEQFGVAWFATSVGQTLLLLPVVAIIDVLLAHPRSFGHLAWPARSLAYRAGLIQAAMSVVAGAVLSYLYPSKQGLFIVMAIVAMRPLVDSVAIVPMSGLRIGLRYGTLAKVDCVVALCASVSSVAMALLGAGAAAIVLPPIAAILVRGVVYGRSAPSLAWTPGSDRLRRVLRHRFVVAALGSYVGSSVFMLEMVVLGVCVSTKSLGLFAFAFGLATQINGAISYQAAGVLQPIVARLAHDPDRQTAATLRAVQLLTGTVVPVLLVQCAVGAPMIRVAWHGKWDEAIVLFSSLSIAQAVFACQSPAAFVLKAQGRFRGYLKLQVANIVVGAIVFLVAIRWLVDPLRSASDALGVAVAPDAAAPFAVVVASFAIVCVFSPLMLWMACRPGRLGMLTVLDAIWRPWIAAIPVAVAAGFAARSVEQLQLSNPAGLVAQLAIAGIGCACGIIISVSTRAETRGDAWNGVRSSLRFFATSR